MASIMVIFDSSNCLMELPKELCKLTQLQVMIYSCTTNLHMLYTIQVLYVGENKLKCLPDDIGLMSGLSEFDVSNCELTRLPESLSSCTSLTKLWVSHNRFVLHCTFTHTLTIHICYNCLSGYQGCQPELAVLGNSRNFT